MSFSRRRNFQTSFASRYRFSTIGYPNVWLPAYKEWRGYDALTVDDTSVTVDSTLITVDQIK